MENFEGQIYFTGHLCGGTVAPLLQVLTSEEMPKRDLNAMGFAAMPHMDDDTSTLHKDKIAWFVNNADIVPTLSVANLYLTLWALVPFFSGA
jgi:hypothetical protein